MNENKKAPEELADEALDAVAGGACGPSFANSGAVKCCGEILSAPENKKGVEALPDEALDAVSGGVFVTGICDECHKKKQVMLYLYEKQGESRLLCRECIADIKKAKK